MTDNNKEKDLEVFEADSNKEVIKNEDPAKKIEEKKAVIGTNSYKEHGTSKECKMVVGFIL